MMNNNPYYHNMMEEALGDNFVRLDSSSFSKKLIGRIEISIQMDALDRSTLSVQDETISELSSALAVALKAMSESLGKDMNFCDPQLIYKPWSNGERPTLRAVTLCLEKDEIRQ